MRQARLQQQEPCRRCTHSSGGRWMHSSGELGGHSVFRPERERRGESQDGHQRQTDSRQTDRQTDTRTAGPGRGPYISRPRRRARSFISGRRDCRRSWVRKTDPCAGFPELHGSGRGGIICLLDNRSLSPRVWAQRLGSLSVSLSPSLLPFLFLSFCTRPGVGIDCRGRGGGGQG